MKELASDKEFKQLGVSENLLLKAAEKLESIEVDEKSKTLRVKS